MKQRSLGGEKDETDTLLQDTEGLQERTRMKVEAKDEAKMRLGRGEG